MLGPVSQSGDESRGLMKIELQVRTGRERRDRGDEGDVVMASDRGLDSLGLLLGGVHNCSSSSLCDFVCIGSEEAEPVMVWRMGISRMGGRLG